MINIFQEGDFSTYSEVDLNGCRAPISELSQYSTERVTVFISHKHNELEELKGIIGFLQKNYNVKVYIDSQDPTLPRITSAKTAAEIKSRIQKCDKFILLATNAAVESKWCNWELGYGDALKYKNNDIAILPMQPKGISSQYKGNEYLNIYPHIVWYCELDGMQIRKVYYVATKNPVSEGYTNVPLEKWLDSNNIF